MFLVVVSVAFFLYSYFWYIIPLSTLLLQHFHHNIHTLDYPFSGRESHLSFNYCPPFPFTPGNGITYGDDDDNSNDSTRDYQLSNPPRPATREQPFSGDLSAARRCLREALSDTFISVVVIPAGEEDAAVCSIDAYTSPGLCYSVHKGFK